MNIKSNIWKIYAIQALRWFMVAMPIIVLFFQDNGLTMTEIIVLQAFFSFILVVTEIPSGYFADKYGRKKAIIIGCIAGFLGYVVYSFSYSFWGFLAAEAVLGVSASFISGADSALLYDTLLELKEDAKYQASEGKKIFAESGSEALASVLGGFLATISLRFPFYVEAFVLFFSIPIAWSLIEPKIKSLPKDGEFTSMKQIVVFSLFNNNQVKWLIYYSAIVGASTFSVIWFIQPYMAQIGFSVVMIGFAWAFFQFFTAVTSYNAYRIENWMGRKYSLLILIPLSCLGYVLAGLQAGLLSAAAFLLFYFVRSLNTPIIKDYVNRLISSDIRATVLSVKSMMERLIFVAVGPFIGLLNDLYSLQTAFLFAAIIFAFGGLFAVYHLNKHKILEV